jgi:hypothetical protein
VTGIVVEVGGDLDPAELDRSEAAAGAVDIVERCISAGRPSEHPFSIKADGVHKFSHVLAAE